MNKYITLEPGLKTTIKKVNDNYVKKTELQDILNKITVEADNKNIAIKVGVPKITYDENGSIVVDYNQIIVNLNGIWDERKLKEPVGLNADGLPMVDNPSENIIYLTPISGDLNSSEDPHNAYVEWVYRGKDNGDTWERLGSQTMTTMDVNDVLYNADYTSSTPGQTNLTFVVLNVGQYNEVTRQPEIPDPLENVIYFVPDTSSTDDNIYIEWIYVNNKWDRLGSPSMSVNELNELINDI